MTKENAPTESLDEALAAFDYAVPPELIAQRPASPRDGSRLLAYDRSTGEVAHRRFRDLPSLLPHGAVLVLNETKVIPARLRLTKADTGGEVRALFVQTPAAGPALALVDRKVAPGQTLRLSKRYAFRVLGLSAGRAELEPLFPPEDLPQVLAAHGHAPLPPYIKRHGLGRAALLRKYQTVFAREDGSAAAPTASLHFTPRLLRRLEASGISLVKVTLHVSLGTFAPLTEEHLRTGLLHEESYAVGAAAARTINEARAAGRPVIPVGTTALRCLESAADDSGTISAGRGATRLFIREGYRFKATDGLVTNFHVPRSSLLMLVAALTGRERLMALYRLAVQERYRLFSFGDAMLIK
jgi:S-adenosylmethionine:tRNA ribosyltransferase-isomerase